MLVLSRLKGEEILIGDNIRIIVNKIDGKRVSIGIEAPKDLRILRSEVATNKDVGTVPVSNHS